ncbi:hypothetical protein CDV55_101840 [Aspergillus turcosus]|uniref:HNH nuclease domain-containing protein n=1 Tax=Aspergillus turcosus TaxID=1245748 RepID=A0A397GGS3_9EURO|nr:hypothetical protein CDV55_101840 [Aspergillus turcosus]RLL93916.1 hypothetical protein CFD26_102071 [Aspergillus turcosus]
MKAPESIIPGGVGAELEDPRRQELIERLDRARSGALGEYPSSADCAQEVWAALWLCPVEKLEEFVKQIEMSPGSLAATSLYTEVVLTDIIEPWITAATGDDSSSSAEEEVCSSSMSAEKKSLERDGKRCVIAKMGAAVESAHIYPYSLCSLSGPECNRFWTALAMFWPESVIEDWKRDVCEGDDTEHCANRVTLSANAHVYWGKGLFALKPVSMSEDQKCLELEFHWLRPVPRSSTVLLSNKPSLEESLDRSAENACLFDATTDRRISSGDKIRMETDDPVNRPLPSVKLLKLQWTLQRLASLSGAAEIYDRLNPNDPCEVNEMFDDRARYHLAESKPYSPDDVSQELQRLDNLAEQYPELTQNERFKTRVGRLTDQKGKLHNLLDQLAEETRKLHALHQQSLNDSTTGNQKTQISRIPTMTLHPDPATKILDEDDIMSTAPLALLDDSDDEENDVMVRLYESQEDFCEIGDVFDDNVCVFMSPLSFEANVDKEAAAKTTDGLGSSHGDMIIAVQGV